MISDIFQNAADLIKIFAIIFALFHFLAGFVLYRDVNRISGEIITFLSPVIKRIVLVYVLVLAAIVVVFVFL